MHSSWGEVNDWCPSLLTQRTKLEKGAVHSLKVSDQLAAVVGIFDRVASAFALPNDARRLAYCYHFVGIDKFDLSLFSLPNHKKLRDGSQHRDDR